MFWRAEKVIPLTTLKNWSTQSPTSFNTLDDKHKRWTSTKKFTAQKNCVSCSTPISPWVACKQLSPLFFQPKSTYFSTSKLTMCPVLDYKVLEANIVNKVLSCHWDFGPMFSPHLAHRILLMSKQGVHRHLFPSYCPKLRCEEWINRSSLLLEGSAKQDLVKLFKFECWSPLLPFAKSVHLTSLPSAPFIHSAFKLQVLDFAGNNLQILPREVFSRHGLLNLQKLKLSNCNIGQIDPTAFRGLTNLVELDLSSNILTSVPTPTFSGN